MLLTDNTPRYSTLDLGFDRNLAKPSLDAAVLAPPTMQHIFTSGQPPQNIIAGQLISNLEQQTGVLFNGKTAFDNTQNGYRLGVETSSNTVKFYVGNTTNYFNWTGSSVIIAGSLSVGSINIPDATTANSFHVDSTGNMWLGATTFSAATAKISNAGVLTATSGTFGAWTISGNTFSTTANNILIGTSAGAAITSGTNNVFIGRGAGAGATSANYSICIGDAAGGGGTGIGSTNIFIGQSAGANITTANQNIFLGFQAGYAATTGTENIVFGQSSAASLSTGSSNVILGTYAGQNITTASNNVFLGTRAGFYETGSNKLFIDNAQRASEADARTKALIYGVFASTTDAQQLNINGWYTWIGARRLTGQFNQTSSTILSNVTDLSVTVASGKFYTFEAILYTTSNVAGGVQFSIGGTATSNNIIFEAIVFDGGVVSAQSRATALTGGVGGVTAVTAAYARITGTINVNTGGTLTVMFAQNASNAAASSVLTGSTFIVHNVT